MAKARIKRSKHSATGPYRGYFYQAIRAAQAWVSLEADAELVVEGDEDFDIVRRADYVAVQGAGSAADPEAYQKSVQVKAKNRSIGLRDISSSISRFAALYAEKNALKVDKRLVFLYLSTETLRPESEKFDPLRSWAVREQLDEVALVVAELAAEKGWNVPWPEGVPDWSGFVEVVHFALAQTGLLEAHLELDRLLQVDGRIGDFHQVPELAAMIVYRLFFVSSEDELDLRRLTKADLESVVDELRTGLAKWAQGPQAKNFVGALAAAEKLEQVIWDGAEPLDQSDLAAPPPSTLLKPYFEVIPFLEELRGKELGELKSWCESRLLFSARLVVGEGGSGKTRLLVELCRRLRIEKWHAGFWKERAKAFQVDNITAGSGSRLIVVDQAETRYSLLPSLLDAGAEVARKGVKCRIVLISRSKGGWYKALEAEGANEINHVRLETTKLEPLDRGQDRKTLFMRMVAAFSSALGRPPSDKSFDLNLSDPSFDLVLLLAMAALEVSNDKRKVGTFELLDATFKNESRHWVRWLKEVKGIQNVNDECRWEVAEAVSALALRGLPEPKQTVSYIVKALGELKVLSPEVSATVLVNLLQAFYRRQDSFVPLQPDVLAEHVVMRVLEQLDYEPANMLARVVGAGEDMAPSAPSEFLRNPSVARIRRTNAFELLGRLASRLEALSNKKTDRRRVAAWSEGLLASDPIKCGLPALWAAKSLESEVALLLIVHPLARTLEEADPETVIGLVEEILIGLGRSTFGPLPSLALDVSCARVVVARFDTDPENSLNLAKQVLKSLRRRVEEVSTSGILAGDFEEVMKVYGDLAALRSQELIPYIAEELEFLSNRLHVRGLSKEAHFIAQEAVGIFEALVQRGHGNALQAFASALSTLGHRLSDLDLDRDALQAARRAVDLYRRAKQEGDDVSSVGFFDSLISLGNRLGYLEKYSEAAAVLTEAISLYRRLPKVEASSFRSELAEALSNKGLWLSKSGDGNMDVAVAAAREGLRVQRQIAMELPEASLAVLVPAVVALGSALLSALRPDDSLEELEKGLEEVLPEAVARPAELRHLIWELVSHWRAAAQVAQKKINGTLLQRVEEFLDSFDKESKGGEAHLGRPALSFSSGSTGPGTIQIQ